jgi:general secretion pathway protein C
MVLAVALGMAIARVLRRYFGGIVVGFIAALAFFQGRGAAQLLGMALRGPGPRSSQLPSPALPPPAVESTHRAQVSQRSPFDSSSVAMTSAPAPAHYAGAAFSDPLAWPACDGVRVSIVIESSNPAWSLSTMQASGEPSARLRRLGDDVAGKRVAFIGYNPRQLTPSVWLQGNGNGAFCQASLFGGPTALPAKPDRRHVEAERHLDRALVEQAVSNSLPLMRTIRVVPEQRAGQIIGLRLFGIRPGSLLNTLGLQNGDRLETINGFSLASPEQALQAYARLRSATRLSVRLDRAGQPVQLDLNIN